MAGRSQDGSDARCVCARFLTRRTEEACRPNPEGELRTGDLYSAGPISHPERLAHVALGRARRSGDADLLEYRQGRVRRISPSAAAALDDDVARLLRRARSGLLQPARPSSKKFLSFSHVN